MNFILVAAAIAVFRSIASDEAWLFAGMAAVGLLAVVVQVLVAFAAILARPAEQGRAIGTVTSGVVTGILAARFVAGTVADLGGWRAVYLTSAGLTLIMLGLFALTLPRHSAPDR
ncbi:MFS transporter [Methylorubrum sp. Q1]|uniref:MFS transporter n=1 Tax=Methylorubrum sp. Q1 TaxID=2562453 RepID=UPI001FE21134|nr:MFS transporter [Methylorubrum sp. Q1]